MENVNPGNYMAVLTDYGISKTQAGLPQVVMIFAVDTPEGKRTFTKYLSLKEGKAREITYRAMSACGFDGSPVEAIAGGKGTGCFDLKKPVEVVLDYEDNGKGEQVLRIKFINGQGGGVANRVLPVDASAIGIDFAEEMRKMQIPLGGGTKADDIPF